MTQEEIINELEKIREERGITRSRMNCDIDLSRNIIYRFGQNGREHRYRTVETVANYLGLELILVPKKD